MSGLLQPKETIEFDEELYKKNIKENSFDQGEEGTKADGKGSDTNGGEA